MYTEFQGMRFKIQVYSPEISTILYHGTARSDRFLFPKITKDKMYDPFSWFSTSDECAKRYANLNVMDDNKKDDARVLIYNYKTEFKMLDMTDEETIQNYKKLFCDGISSALKVTTCGKHSMVYRIRNIFWHLKKGGVMLKHILTLKKLGVMGYIEEGVNRLSIDFVFIEDSEEGADKYLNYFSQYLIR